VKQFGFIFTFWYLNLEFLIFYDALLGFIFLVFYVCVIGSVKC
jgi:hypothetical protein